MRIGDRDYNVERLPGFDRTEGETKQFPNILGDLGIPLSTVITKRCIEEGGIQGAKNLNERSWVDLTSKPPLGRTTQGPFSYRGWFKLKNNRFCV